MSVYANKTIQHEKEVKLKTWDIKHLQNGIISTTKFIQAWKIPKLEQNILGTFRFPTNS